MDGPVLPILVTRAVILRPNFLLGLLLIGPRRLLGPTQAAVDTPRPLHTRVALLVASHSTERAPVELSTSGAATGSHLGPANRQMQSEIPVSLNFQ